MTSTMLSPTELPFTDPKFDTTAAPPPKKKRKRTGTGGANDDCFTCTSRSVKCDRKRPYCTQCIDIGKECSGYKTTLTWGVGVASRGKLRGLSCPIADKNADGSDVSQIEMDARRRRKSSTSNSKKEVVPKVAKAFEISPEARRESDAAPAFSEGVGYSQTYPPHVGSAPTPHLQSGWQTPGYQEHLYARRSEGLRTQSHAFSPPQPLQTGPESAFEHLSGPRSGRSVSSYSDAVFYSPMEYPRTPGSLSFSTPLTQSISAPFPTHDGMTSSIDSLSMSGSSLGSYAESATSRVSSIHDQTELVRNSSLSNGVGLEPIEEIFYNENNRGATPTSMANYSSLNAGLQVEEVDDVDVEEVKGLSLMDTRFNSPFFHITPRLQTLMEYYDRAVCPYLVAFDGPENPYRKHVLQLAIQNEGLQHAIAALATNNHRMRSKELRQNGQLAELIDPFGDSTNVEPSGPSAEESCYKQMSIDTLNMQLTNPGAAQDDSVLATLLILCLFHVCDSGFSKFKTQLAGVQKLLSYRQPNTQSDFTRWVEMFFTWFDVMTSTVNDREVQIKGESLAMLDFNVNLGAMEQFSGCDGRLFKLIARLGRLNLLAQGRPVRSQRGDPSTTSSLHPPFPPHPSWRKRSHARVSSLRASDYENMDGNGWGTPILSSDEDADGSADEDVKHHTSATDGRQAFWTEWHDTRTRLEAWQMHHPSIPNQEGDDILMTPERQDMSHINESFRLAALLYTERLGHPLLPSSHDAFQNLVRRALVHITALEVTSCVNKFLLWPLFIIGTECVDEQDRDIIRSRCRDVAEESGFYNNMSSLYVLERVWREVGSNVRGREAEEVRARRRDSEASRPGRYGQAFRWRKAMDRVDGEYIVI